MEYRIKQYPLEQGALEIQYLEEFFGEFPRKKAAAEIVVRLEGREHLLLMAEAPLPSDPGIIVPASYKVMHEIRATEWVGSSKLGANLSHLVNRCEEDHVQYIASHPRGARFKRDKEKYATFPSAASVTVGGTSLSLSARSGMSQWVTLEWVFGTKFALHVLCGTDTYPPQASRIFAGA